MIDNLFLQRILLNIKKEIFVFNTHFFSTTTNSFYLIPILANQFESSGLYINLQQYIQKANILLNRTNNIKSLNTIVKHLQKYSKDIKFNFNYLFFIKDLNRKYQNIFTDLNTLYINNIYLKYFSSFTIEKILLHPLKFSYQNTNFLNNSLLNSYILNYKSTKF